LSNVFSSNPIYIDTDTTVALGTNWRGANGGAAHLGNVGIRPEKLIITPLGATTAGAIKINEITSTGGTTGPVLFQVQVPTALNTAATAQEFDLVGAESGWHDFVVTGVTAAGVALELFYRP